jgi:hypothetical protein
LSRSDRYAAQAREIDRKMRFRAGVMVLFATPLILVDLGLLLVAGFMLGSALALTVPVFPSFWPLTLVAAVSAAVYVACLVFAAADALRDGVRQLATPVRMLDCSLFGFAMNSLGALLGFVVLGVTLALSGSVF